MTEFNPKDFEEFKEFIVAEIDEGFFHVRCNNPKTLNAFSERTWRSYGKILEKLDSMEDSKVIIISSTVPKAFSSGLNLKDALSEMGQYVSLNEEEKVKKLYEHIRDFQYCIGTPARIDTPTICVLNGICFGLALDIAACCSIRIATRDAKFSIREIKIGIPADIGSLQRLPALVNNKSLLYQYCLTGVVFGAEEALNLGLISRIEPDLETAIKYAMELGHDINLNATWAVRGTKRHIQQILNGSSVETGLNNIADYNAKNINKDFIAAISSVKL